MSADTGTALVVEKLSQIKPVLLFADNAVTSHGKIHDSSVKTREVVRLLPSVRLVVLFQTVESLPVVTEGIEVDGLALTYDEFLAAYVFYNLSNVF